MIEKRAYQRSPIELAASFGIPEADEIIQSAQVLNMSVDGFCISSEKPIKPQKSIDLNVELTEYQTITLKAEVVWCRLEESTKDYRVGIKILDTRTEDFETFYRFYSQFLNDSRS